MPDAPVKMPPRAPLMRRWYLSIMQRSTQPILSLCSTSARHPYLGFWPAPAACQTWIWMAECTLGISRIYLLPFLDKNPQIMPAAIDNSLPRSDNGSDPRRMCID